MNFTDFEKQTTWQTVTCRGSFSLSNLHVGHYGYEKTPSDKGYVSNHNPDYRLHFITEGNLTLFAGDCEYNLKKNDCYVIRPDMPTAYQTAETGAAYYWCTLNGSYAKAFLEQLGFSEHSPYQQIPAKYQKRLHQAFFENFLIYEQSEGTTDFVFLENLMKIARLIFSSSRANTPLQTEKHSKYVDRALSLLNENFSNPDFSVKKVADELFIHPNYFSTVFKKEMGVNFNYYLTQRRVEYAVSLIASGHTKVNEIAEAVGIPDCSYFTKLYKKFQNISPSQEIEKRKNQKRSTPKKK